MNKNSKPVAAGRLLAWLGRVVRLSLGVALIAGLTGCDALQTRYLEWMLKDRTDYSLASPRA